MTAPKAIREMMDAVGDDEKVMALGFIVGKLAVTMGVDKTKSMLVGFVDATAPVIREQLRDTLKGL